MDISFTVCCCCNFVSVFVRLRISPPRIKLAASNFAWWFIGVRGRESQILGNFAPPEAQNRTTRPALMFGGHRVVVVSVVEDCHV